MEGSWCPGFLLISCGLTSKLKGAAGVRELVCAGPSLSLSRVVGKWEGMLGIVPAREK